MIYLTLQRVLQIGPALVAEVGGQVCPHSSIDGRGAGKDPSNPRKGGGRDVRREDHSSWLGWRRASQRHASCMKRCSDSILTRRPCRVRA